MTTEGKIEFLKSKGWTYWEAGPPVLGEKIIIKTKDGYDCAPKGEGMNGYYVSLDEAVRLERGDPRAD